MKKIKENFDYVARFLYVHLGIITFIVIAFVILFSVLFVDLVIVFLQFCDKRPESISVILTVFITLVTGLITIFQTRTLKRKGKIRTHSLYNSIAKFLEMNKDNIISTIEKYPEEDRRRIVLMAKEWMISQETVNRVYELEKLLYEHGKRGDTVYTQNTISVIGSMHRLAHVINIAYSFLKEENNVIVQDLLLYELEEKLVSLEKEIEAYKIDYLKKYIPL